ncbi:hypothetical protein ACI65C_003409 [Semiaphis heraclei]
MPYHSGATQSCAHSRHVRKAAVKRQQQQHNTIHHETPRHPSSFVSYDTWFAIRRFRAVTRARPHEGVMPTRSIIYYSFGADLTL